MVKILLNALKVEGLKRGSQCFVKILAKVLALIVDVNHVLTEVRSIFFHLDFHRIEQVLSERKLHFLGYLY